MLVIAVSVVAGFQLKSLLVDARTSTGILVNARTLRRDAAMHMHVCMYCICVLWVHMRILVDARTLCRDAAMYVCMYCICVLWLTG